MKKGIVICLAVVLAVMMFSACTQTADDSTAETQDAQNELRGSTDGGNRCSGRHIRSTCYWYDNNG